MAIWEKFNPRERLEAIGAGLVIIAWLAGVVARGFGLNSIGLLGGAAVLVILYLKYAPNQNITWPLAVSLINLGISAIVALIALLTLLDWLGFLNVITVTGLVSLGLFVVGAAIMVWGAWQEYQVDKPAMPNFSTGASAGSTAPPPVPPPAAPPPGAPAPGAAVPPPAAAAPAPMADAHDHDHPHDHDHDHDHDEAPPV